MDVFLTRCRISTCQGLGQKKHDEISEIDRINKKGARATHALVQGELGVKQRWSFQWQAFPRVVSSIATLGRENLHYPGGLGIHGTRYTSLFSRLEQILCMKRL